MKSGSFSNKPPDLMTAHKVETISQSRLIEERRIGELVKYNHEAERLSMSANSEVQASNTRRANSVSREANETIQQQIELEKEELKRKEKHLKQEGKRREDDEKKERMKRILIETEIQRICETSEELKELERNLKMAYVSKGRATQYEEKFFLKKIEDERERVIDEVMEIDRQNRIQQENMKEVNRREKLLAQKMVLQEQMHENEVRGKIYFFEKMFISITLWLW